MQVWQDIDTDRVEWFDIEEKLKKLGYGEISKLCYFVPGLKRRNGIRYLRKYSDINVPEMFKWEQNGDIHLYVEANDLTVSQSDNQSIECIRDENCMPNSQLNEGDAISFNDDWDL